MNKLHHTNNKKVICFDWNKFSAKLKKLFEFDCENTRVAINADRWEEFIYIVLKNMGEKYKGGDPKWILGSHQPGTDIWIDKFNISAKSGNIQNNNLIISSNRLTRFNNLDEMKKFIDSPIGKNFDIYLCSARIDQKNGDRVYKIFLVDANIFQAKKLQWEDTYLKNGNSHSGWRGANNKGIEVEIRKKMSNQLWLTIPLRMCNLLFEVTILKDKMGSGVDKILKN
ncbi:MAG: hypothetical protein Q7R92_03030 [bacterium]|nr:hypothetical protein [bacterium]